jgi:hypothetical protein
MLTLSRCFIGMMKIKLQPIKQKNQIKQKLIEQKEGGDLFGKEVNNEFQ